jgi:hypothetical protein
VRDRDGAEVWLVAVKGTFLIGPDGSTSQADVQERVCLSPVYRGQPGKSSLLYDTDLNHTKVNTDLVVNGCAYSPPGRPTRRVDVTLRGPGVNKTVRVFGDRLWKSSAVGLAMTEPEPFTRMPLTYERAYGGRDESADDPRLHSWDERNPVGLGFAVRNEGLAGKHAPNLESPDQPITAWDTRPRPAAFGPVAGHWKPRVELAGTYDDKWAKERQPLLASDFDERFYQCTPADQQAHGFLVGGELIELSNMTPSGAIGFRLPRVALAFKTDFEDGTSASHRANLHTVVVEPDVPRVMLVWHTQLPCHHKVLKLKTTSITLKRRIPLGESPLVRRPLKSRA